MSQISPAGSVPLGIMNQMWAAKGVSDAEALRLAIEETCHADQLGFDSIWIGEHHGHRPEQPFWGRVPAAEILLGHLAARTSRIAVGSGVRILSSTSAQRTAEEMSLLHVLTGGRVQYGIGLGSFQPGMTETREQKALRFRALMDEILGLLAGEPIHGDAVLSPEPSPEIVDKIWASARDKPTIGFLAERGLNFVVGQAELGVVQADYIRHYRQSGGTGLTRGVRLVFVADTHEAAIAGSEEAAQIYFGQMGGKGYHKEAVDKGLLPPTIDTPEELRRQVSFYVGTAEEVARELNAYAAETGVDRVDVMVQIPGLGTREIRRSMELIQEEVRPLLRMKPLQIPASTAA